MSPVCENFIRAVIAQNWRTAFDNLNGLNMFEMLRGLAALDPLDLTDLWARNNFTNAVNTPRIEYAYDVVKNRRLPATAPGDLKTTGQVTDAQKFIAHPTPLTFENDLTGNLPAVNAHPPVLSEANFVAAAATLKVEVAAIRAVATVESGGRHGFAADGRPIVRYELHQFHEKTGGHYGRSDGPYNLTHPHLSQPTLEKGNPYHNGKQSNEWSMIFGAMILRDAKRIRRFTEAWKSTSWGMFQVMGFNHTVVGWTDITSFVTSMMQSEDQQMKAFIGYCRANHLISYIQNHNWTDFAMGYNGSKKDAKGVRHVVGQYDVKLENAYVQISAARKKQKLIP